MFTVLNSPYIEPKKILVYPRPNYNVIPSRPVTPNNPLNPIAHLQSNTQYP
ncbi:Translation initiation factor IF-2 [Gossypium arboreum]|uniref:Translation initiation factor IF-2 n=1 Tax=Gossypium arboreum TaxID=29729 RepID=A0A0B0NHM5_GOSAR|nr:Translation initiation factor IF-2 [Gossypium arboreum]